MRTAFDFSPLFRSTVGFDRIFDLLDNAQRVSTIDNWPPYDIVKTGEDQYRVTLAVAGFGESEVQRHEHREVRVGQRAGQAGCHLVHVRGAQHGWWSGDRRYAPVVEHRIGEDALVGARCLEDEPGGRQLVAA